MSDNIVFLTKEQILGAKDLITESIHVPQWGGYIRVRGLTAGERDRFEASLFIQDKNGKQIFQGRNLRARLVSAGIVDEDGNRLFTEAEVDHLGRKSAGALEILFDRIRELSGMSEEDIKELEGNSNGQSDDSSSS